MKLLADGQLYVAQWLPTANDPSVDSGTGVWHPLDTSNPEACAFTTRWVEDNIVSQVGGTLAQFRVPRAEDCEVLPNDRRSVLIALRPVPRAATRTEVHRVGGIPLGFPGVPVCALARGDQEGLSY